LGSFIAAGLRPQSRLAKAIVLILVIKLIGLVAIKSFLFPDSAKPVADAAAIARVIGLRSSQQ
jgi:hypothetical protein